jgi:hypothetical protein
MPEDALNVAKIAAARDLMRRKRVPQRMRRDLIDSRSLSVLLQDQPESLTRQAVTTMVQEQCRLVRALRYRRTSELKVLRQSRRGPWTELDIAPPVLFPGAADGAALKVNVVEIEADQLRDPHSSRIQRLQHRAIT